MSRRIPMCLALVLIALPGWASLPDSPKAMNPTASAGVVSLRLVWDSATPLPAGALIACRARVSPLERGANAEAVAAAVELPGQAGQCALEIPLAWQGGSVTGSVLLSYEMDAIAGAKTVARKSGSQVVALPCAGEKIGVAARL